MLQMISKKFNNFGCLKNIENEFKFAILYFLSVLYTLMSICTNFQKKKFDFWAPCDFLNLKTLPRVRMRAHAPISKKKFDLDSQK
jgi:hypothetical protein